MLSAQIVSLQQLHLYMLRLIVNVKHIHQCSICKAIKRLCHAIELNNACDNSSSAGLSRHELDVHQGLECWELRR